jgi:predicted dehydrogenase
MIRIGIIGLGHWGPNYLRIFNQLEHSKVVSVCDQDKNKKNLIKNTNIKFYSDYKDMLKDPDIDACVIATPASTHYSIAKEFIKTNRDVLVEKPLAVSVKECEELVNLAVKKNVKLMVGHTFLFNDGINWLKNFIFNNGIGKPYYFYAVRTNLGPIREDVDALLDLATHDISIFYYILEEKPVYVSAVGSSFLNKKRVDVATLKIKFTNNVDCYAHVSWLQPCKIRQITVVGDKKMVVFDDVNVNEPIRIYDKSVEIEKTYSDFGEFKMILRDGDIVVPKIKMVEPLKNQCQHFIDCIISNKKIISDGKFGLEIVKVLEAAEKSLRQGGKEVKIEK